jgi:glycerophosphoryl diester phosphodiesterase
MKNTAVILLCLLLSCDKIDYVPDNPFANIPTIVIMHRGNGTNTDYEENTLPGALYGLSVHDGIELDIEISESKTLWLDHDNEVRDCNGNIKGCFSQMTDEEIAVYNECNGEPQYYTLESVLQEMSVNYPTKYLILDVKSQYCKLTSTKEEMVRMADAVIALVKKYHMGGKVVAESSSVSFMERIANENSIGQSWVVLEDLDKGLSDAYKLNARVISYDWGASEPITGESVELIHRKGFGAIIFVVNDPEDIAAAWRMKPDVIQTDNPDFRSYIPLD